MSHCPNSSAGFRYPLSHSSLQPLFDSLREMFRSVSYHRDLLLGGPPWPEQHESRPMRYYMSQPMEIFW